MPELGDNQGTQTLRGEVGSVLGRESVREELGEGAAFGR